jgi:hypothetical protein
LLCAHEKVPRKLQEQGQRETKNNGNKENKEKRPQPIAKFGGLALINPNKEKKKRKLCLHCTPKELRSLHQPHSHETLRDGFDHKAQELHRM